MQFNMKNKYENLLMNDFIEKWISIIIVVTLVGVLIFKHFIMFLPPGPNIFWDEFLYKENAEALFQGNFFYNAHYPPLYSLVISIALYFNNWYESIQIINGILSSLLIIPVWMISKMFVSSSKALLAVLLVTLLPFQAIYPGLVMSENLFLFIFAFTVYFSIQGANSTTWKAGLFGVFLGLGYLTKYLMLPAIPIFILFWIIFPIYQMETRFKFLASKRFWLNCFVLLASFLLIMLPWIIYAQKANVFFYNALGLSYAGSTIKTFSSEISLDNLLMWGSLYAAYIVLALAPFLTLLMFYIPTISFSRKKKNKRKHELLFLLLLVILTGLYWLIATQHSFRAEYNYPNPYKLLGRYLMFLTPLFIVAGIIALDRIFRYRDMLKKHYIVAITYSMIILTTLAWWILFKNGIWVFPSHFANTTVNSPDTFVYRNSLIIIQVLVSIVIIGISIIILPKANIKKYRVLYIVTIGVIIILQGTIFHNSTKIAKKNIHGIHARNVAKVLNSGMVEANNIPVYYSVRGILQRKWPSVSRFWNAPKLKYIPIADSIHVYDTIESVLYLTEDSLPITPLISYKFYGGNCYLYKLNQQTSNYKLNIIKYGPHTIKTGKEFNIQSSGESVIWIKANLFSRATVMYFGGIELKTSVKKKKNEFIYYGIVPNYLFEKIATKEIYLLDKTFGIKSEPAIIEIK